ncbi:MAG: His/Gly/Thr/Pro-type tRNA ligase C-terminal domain-containing protein, partial [Defluviitaleaceae bacterium]|nr:His/Gly/Thr/Pro-type tRNA ligase C-terminal domain-containing protein [Defluviitaleaceae bacterium]
CGFASNLEVAERIGDCPTHLGTVPGALERLHTPGIKTIDDLCKHLNTCASKLMKAVVHKQESDGAVVVAFVRGDLDISETKLRNHLGAEITQTEGAKGLVAGFIGAVGLEGVKMVFDRSLEGMESIIGGANEKDYHISGISMSRDLPNAQLIDIATAKDGDTCPSCAKPSLKVSNGVEVGNIFQLGDKYSRAMGMTYQDAQGGKHHPVMGCYGIGVGRVAASVLEACHDDYGPIWPISVAPWQVQLCALNVKKNPEIRDQADQIYNALRAAGIEVIYDDREVSAGHMFADADLFGIPLRLVISPKTTERGCVELVYRDKSHKADLPLDPDAIVEEVNKHIKLLFDAL